MVKVRSRGSERSWLCSHGVAKNNIFIEIVNVVCIERMKKLTRACQTTRISKILLNLRSKLVFYFIKLPVWLTKRQPSSLRELMDGIFDVMSLSAFKPKYAQLCKGRYRELPY